MSSERFENCCEDLSQIYKDLDTFINVTIPKESGERRKGTIRQAQKKLDEANRLLTEVDTDLHQAPASYRNQMSNRARSLRRKYEQYKYQLGEVVSGGASGGQGRDQLLGNEGDTAVERAELDYRSKLIKGAECLNSASESVARSQRVAEETDQIGVEILTDLGDQRESLVRTRDTLTDTNAELGKSRKLIFTIGKRVFTNKILLSIIVLLELGLIGLVVYLKFFNKHK